MGLTTIDSDLPEDDRVERMIADPEAYFTEARERAEAQAHESVRLDLEKLRLRDRH